MSYKFYFPHILFIVFVGTWIFLSIDPWYPDSWVLENILVLLFVPIVLLSYFKFRLSNLSYFLIFLFAVLHLFGAHYTYSNIPWGDTISQLLDLDRNHYDRVVHFIYGVFMVPVLFDLFKKYLSKYRLIKIVLIFSLIIAAGSLYEIGEFVVGIIAESKTGLAFLGSQGDVWDTQKDILLQVVGASVGLLLFMPLVNRLSPNKLRKN